MVGTKSTIMDDASAQEAEARPKASRSWAICFRSWGFNR